MSRILAWIAGLYCIGIALGSVTTFRFWFLCALTIGCLMFCALFINRKASSLVILLVIPALFGMMLLRNSQDLPQSHISNFIYYKNNIFYTVKGFVAQPAEIKDGVTTFIFEAKELHCKNLHQACCGKVLVTVRGAQDLDYAQGLILRGYLYPLSQQLRKGYLRERDVHCLMRVESENAVIKLGKGRGCSVKWIALYLKSKIKNVVREYLAPIPAAVLSAMVLGDQNGIPRIVYDSMVKAGTVHILVVSGFNVGIVIFITTLILKLIRIPRRARFLIAIPCIIMYCLVTGASNPVVRATVMGVFFLIANIINREPDIYNSLSLAAIIILLISPRQLFNIGFQLSFASVISIVYLYPRTKTFLHIGYLKIRAVKAIAEGAAVSLSAWLGTCGFIAYYFRIVSPVTVLANLFVVPLATLITLCGICLVIAGLLCRPWLHTLPRPPNSRSRSWSNSTYF